MKACVTPEEMYAIEKLALSKGLVSIDGMMEQVGLKTAQRALMFSEQMTTNGVECPRIVVFTGKGNNGADGYTAACFLLKMGCEVMVVPVEAHEPNEQHQKKRQEYLLLGGRERALNELFPPELPHIAIDAVYGIGMKGASSESALKAIRWSNSVPMPTIAIDIPSGVNPLSGEVLVDAFRADVTVACQFPKMGYFFLDGRNYVGEIECVDMGLEMPTPSYVLLEESDVELLLPRYTLHQDKFSRGVAFLVGGSPGLMGACALAAKSSLFSGVGYLQGVFRSDVWKEIAILPPECVKKKLPRFCFSKNAFFSNLFSRGGAVMLGPGLGRDRCARSSFHGAMKASQGLFRVIDADGFFWLSRMPRKEGALNNTIITPHKGEIERLLKRSVAITTDAISEVREKILKGSPGSVCVLKGSPTFILQEGSNVTYVMAEVCPNMATLGTGDVLTGILGALLAQGLTTHDAALLGVWVHQLSGKYAAKEASSYSTPASRIIKMLPRAFSHLVHARAYGAVRDFVPACRAESSSVEHHL